MKRSSKFLPESDQIYLSSDDADTEMVGPAQTNLIKSSGRWSNRVADADVHKPSRLSPTEHPSSRTGVPKDMMYEQQLKLRILSDPSAQLDYKLLAKLLDEWNKHKTIFNTSP